MTIDQMARYYFQDKLSKFCPADKTERPNGFENAMFRYGVEHGFQQALDALRSLINQHSEHNGTKTHVSYDCVRLLEQLEANREELKNEVR